MSAAKFTPGPWVVMPCPVNQGKHPFHDHRWITTAGTYTETGAHDSDWAARGGVLICEMRDGPTANARLLAAAPDLLAALKGAESALRKALPFCPADAEAHFVGEWLGEVVAAIAKAEVAS